MLIQHYIQYAKKRWNILWPTVPQRRIYYHCLWVNYQLLGLILLKLPNLQLLAAVDHNQLRKMADGRFNWVAVTSQPFEDSIPWAPLAKYKSVQPLLGIEPATFRIRGGHWGYKRWRPVRVRLCNRWHADCWSRGRGFEITEGPDKFRGK